MKRRCCCCSEMWAKTGKQHDVSSVVTCLHISLCSLFFVRSFGSDDQSSLGWRNCVCWQRMKPKDTAGAGCCCCWMLLCCFSLLLPAARAAHNDWTTGSQREKRENCNRVRSGTLRSFSDCSSPSRAHHSLFPLSPVSDREKRRRRRERRESGIASLCRDSDFDFSFSWTDHPMRWPVRLQGVLQVVWSQDSLQLKISVSLTSDNHLPSLYPTLLLPFPLTTCERPLLEPNDTCC